MFGRIPSKLAAALCGVALWISAGAGQADPLDDLFGELVRENADGALAVFGITAVPSETASTLFLNTGSSPNRDYDFKAAQLGGGFRVSEDFPLWLEGYIGYNRYDPVLLLSDSGTTSELPLKWSSFGATGGVGWEFDLSPDLVFRPVAHLTLGRVQSDLSVGAQLVADALGLDVGFLKNGGITVGGYGGSVALDYNKRWENDYELDITLKYTKLILETIAGDKELEASSVAETTGLWSRLRIPTGKRLYNRPVRTVAEFSASSLTGDQGVILHTDWLAQIGGGFEIDLEETWVPWVTTTRLMARYTWGENLEGFSIGLSASF